MIFVILFNNFFFSYSWTYALSDVFHSFLSFLSLKCFRWYQASCTQCFNETFKVFDMCCLCINNWFCSFFYYIRCLNTKHFIIIYSYVFTPWSYLPRYCNCIISTLIFHVTMRFDANEKDKHSFNVIEWWLMVTNS